MASILVVAAVPQELGASFLRGKDGVRILYTGIGPHRAWKKVNRFLSTQKVDLVVSTGFAGGARPGLGVGDLVMASEAVEASSGRRLYPDRRFLSANGARAVGPFVTTESVSDIKRKAGFGERFGAVGVDMETAAVARAAASAGVPWVGFRVILDPMEQNLTVSSLRGAFRLLAKPFRWGELFRFLGSIRVASRSLAQGLDRLVSSVSSSFQL